MDVESSDASAVAVSPATSTKVRRRSALRKDAWERQQKLNEERDRRDEQELDLAADFAAHSEERTAAQQAVHASELEMGRIVDELIGVLRLRYSRVAELLDIPEDELRRIRQLAADSRSSTDSATDDHQQPTGGAVDNTRGAKKPRSGQRSSPGSSRGSSARSTSRVASESTDAAPPGTDAPQPPTGAVDDDADNADNADDAVTGGG